MWCDALVDHKGRCTLEHAVLIASFVLMLVFLCVAQNVVLLHIGLGMAMMACAYGIPALKVPRLRAYRVVAAVFAVLSSVTFLLMTLGGVVGLFYVGAIIEHQEHVTHAHGQQGFAGITILSYVIGMAILIIGLVASCLLATKHVHNAKDDHRETDDQPAEIAAIPAVSSRIEFPAYSTGHYEMPPPPPYQFEDGDKIPK